VTETTTASPASRNAESVNATSRFHTAAQTCTRAVCAVAMVVIAVSASPPTATADPAPVTATVLKVVDGDTIDIRDDVRGRLRVRVLGIDTPETKRPGYTVGCWGPQATDFAESTLLGQRVALVTDPRKTCTTDTVEPWLIWASPVAGTTPPRRLAPEWRTPTCTPVIPLRAMLLSQRRSKRRGTPIAACGVRRATATQKLSPDEVGRRRKPPSPERGVTIMSRLRMILLMLLGFGLMIYPTTLNAPLATLIRGNDSTLLITPRPTCNPQGYRSRRWLFASVQLK
jgi:micrococcal nuclease